MAATAPTNFGRPRGAATAAGTGNHAVERSTALRLTTTIALLATVASAGGLFLPHLYRDNTFVVSAWKGTDLVTLFVAVPTLVAAASLAGHGSMRALLIWFGLLDYMLYNYGFYLFGAAFNAFFLLYAALFTLSIFALMFGLAKADVGDISRRFDPDTPVKWISSYMLVVAGGLSAVYLIQIVTFVVTGRLPAIVVMTGHPTSVVFALDLSLLVPGLVLGVLAGILNVKGAVYTLALAVASASAARKGVPGAADQIPLWLILSFGSLTASVFLLVHLMPASNGAPA